MSDLIDTTEMYLRTIYELEEEGLTPLRARIAERIGHSGPTVSQTVARMERDGLVVVEEDRHLSLTIEGQAKAMRVMRKHRLAERLLTDVIGLEWSRVHDEACRWEHVMSEQVERRLVEILDHPAVSPYGNPIPGLDELGDDQPDAAFLDGVARLTDVVDQAAAGRCTVVRLGEHLQTLIPLMARIEAAGALPGAVVTAERVPPAGVRIVADGGAPLTLEHDAARHIFVAR
ncbi:MAG: metal-dependent transcriptional regulator [Bifidobacteriaceae bacterium]|nr:metal-dependent transcriptional regulator [Bifidobacteriaceae bacterium]